MLVDGKHYRTVWMDGLKVRLINQPLLPHRFEITATEHHEQTARAIHEMVVRGAPAIGATAAFGMVQVVLEAPDGPRRDDYIEQGDQRLRSTRPTAQNLFYALDRVRASIEGLPVSQQAETARAEAEAIADEDAAGNEAIGEQGKCLIEDGMTVLTHCNAGWLATVDWGTALSPIYKARRDGLNVNVLADETRPRCQGANLTAWELFQEKVPVEVIADNAAGLLMRRGDVQLAITGADRVAANGDVANKIGTYEKALLAREHDVPFYVAVPEGTFDPACPNGDSIPIEERCADEVLYAWGQTDQGVIERVRLAPEGVGARNPAFDITPAALVAGFITPRGVFDATAEALTRAFGAAAGRSV